VRDIITLGVETSGPFTSLALIRGETIICEFYSGREFSHSEVMNLAFKSIIETAGIEVEDIGLVSVSIGPGYFTALRAGLSFAKGLVYVIGSPLVAVDTLDALAWEITPGKGAKIVATMDAQKGQVYASFYISEENRWKKTEGPVVISPEELRERAMGALFIGSGSEKYRDILYPRPLKNPSYPGASTIAKLGLSLYLDGVRSDPSALEPLYLRLTDAEMKRFKNGTP
jgi:tRNA threonylcarbamoyladenosine biosynthesis protein TsaB